MSDQEARQGSSIQELLLRVLAEIREEHLRSFTEEQFSTFTTGMRGLVEFLDATPVLWEPPTLYPQVRAAINAGIECVVRGYVPWSLPSSLARRALADERIRQIFTDIGHQMPDQIDEEELARQTRERATIAWAELATEDTSPFSQRRPQHQTRGKT